VAASTDKHPMAYWYNVLHMKVRQSDQVAAWMQRNNYSLAESYIYEDAEMFFTLARLEDYKKESTK
jgi:hypothetical protein